MNLTEQIMQQIQAAGAPAGPGAPNQDLVEQLRKKAQGQGPPAGWNPLPPGFDPAAGKPPVQAPLPGIAMPTATPGLPAVGSAFQPGPFGNPAASLVAGRYPQLAAAGGVAPQGSDQLGARMLAGESGSLSQDQQKAGTAWQQQNAMNQDLRSMFPSLQELTGKASANIPIGGIGYAMDPMQMLGLQQKAQESAMDAYGKQQGVMAQMLGTQGQRDVGFADIGMRGREADAKQMLEMAKLQHEIGKENPLAQLIKAHSVRLGAGFAPLSDTEARDSANQVGGMINQLQGVLGGGQGQQFGLSNAPPPKTVGDLVRPQGGGSAPSIGFQNPGAMIGLGGMPHQAAAQAASQNPAAATGGAPDPRSAPFQMEEGIARDDAVRRLVEDTARGFAIRDPKTGAYSPVAGKPIDEFMKATQPLWRYHPDYFNETARQAGRIYGNQGFEDWRKGFQSASFPQSQRTLKDWTAAHNQFLKDTGEKPVPMSPTAMDFSLGWLGRPLLDLLGSGQSDPKRKNRRPQGSSDYFGEMRGGDIEGTLRAN